MAQITPDTLPDYHFLLLAPNLEADWLFVAARAYWERFSVTIISDGALLALIPPERTVAVCILTRPDAFRAAAVSVLENREDVYIDALVYDTPEQAQITLDARARDNQPFGVALIPTAVPPTQAPIIATVGPTPTNQTPVPTPNTSGFVTQVPTNPPGFITQTPSPQPNNEQPLSPTPGSILGG
jgi:hypothetical protein